MAVIGIHYEEGTPGKDYKGIYLHYHDKDGNSKEMTFFSGNFVKDWYAHNKFISNEMDGEFKYEHHFSYSSSRDHFIMDGAPFISKYLKIEDEKPYLTSSYNLNKPGTECFLPKGKEDWTWEEYKEYCNG